MASPKLTLQTRGFGSQAPGEGSTVHTLVPLPHVPGTLPVGGSLRVTSLCLSTHRTLWLSQDLDLGTGVDRGVPLFLGSRCQSSFLLGSLTPSEISSLKQDLGKDCPVSPSSCLLETPDRSLLQTPVQLLPPSCLLVSLYLPSFFHPLNRSLAIALSVTRMSSSLTIRSPRDTDLVPG